MIEWLHPALEAALLVCTGIGVFVSVSIKATIGAHQGKVAKELADLRTFIVQSVTDLERSLKDHMDTSYMPRFEVIARIEGETQNLNTKLDGEIRTVTAHMEGIRDRFREQKG